MIKIIKFIWGSVGVCAAINFAVYGVQYAGAWLGFNEIPAPSLSTQALAFFMGAFFMIEATCPQFFDTHNAKPGPQR